MRATSEKDHDGLRNHLGITVVLSGPEEFRAEMPVRCHVTAPGGHIHAGSIVAFAVDLAGEACLTSLPPSALGFVTMELKSNHLFSPHDGWIDCVARAVHLGRTTQVWDAVVTHRESGKNVAIFRCTQMLLYKSCDADP